MTIVHSDSGTLIAADHAADRPTRWQIWQVGTAHFIPLLDAILPWIVAVPLLYSALIHIANPYYFLNTVYQYRIGPAWLGYLVAAFLPFLQLFIGVALLGRLFGWIPKLFAACVFYLFAGIQIVSVLRGLDISCGCFGASDVSIGWGTILLPLCLGFLTTLHLYISSQAGRSGGDT